MPFKQRDKQPCHKPAIVKMMLARIYLATFFAFAACTHVASAKSSPTNLVPPPANCTIEQEEPLLKTGASKKLNRSLSLRLCGNDHLVWLSESDASGRAQSATRQLQVFKLPELGAGEKYDISVGACSAKKKPLMRPLIIKAKWGQKTKVSHNRGLISAWWYDPAKDTVVERSVLDLACETDTP